MWISRTPSLISKCNFDENLQFKYSQDRFQWALRLLLPFYRCGIYAEITQMDTFSKDHDHY